MIKDGVVLIMSFLFIFILARSTCIYGVYSILTGLFFPTIGDLVLIPILMLFRLLLALGLIDFYRVLSSNFSTIESDFVFSLLDLSVRINVNKMHANAHRSPAIYIYKYVNGKKFQPKPKVFVGKQKT